MSVSTMGPPLPAYRVPCRRRWLVAFFALGGVVLLSLTSILPSPVAIAVVLAVAGLVGYAIRYLLRPPPMVRLNEEGLVFDSTRARWADIAGIEVRETFFGRRLRARVAQRKQPRLFQPFVPVPLDDVLVEVTGRAPAGDLATVELPPTRPARFRRPVISGLVLLALVGLAQFPIPVAHTEGPAPTEAVSGLLPGAPARPGSILVLAVRENYSASAVELVRAWLDDAVDAHWRLPWQNRQDQAASRRRGDLQRRTFEAAATAAASACGGRSAAIEGGGVVVTSFLPLVAGTGLLQRGDRILAAGGRPVASYEDFYAALVDGQALGTIVVDARGPGGVIRSATVPIGTREGAPLPRGLWLDLLPMQLTAGPARVDLGGLAGGSAGLASALGLVDASGPALLAAGRRVAVTGAIAPDGRVGPIAGLPYKAAAAQRAHASTLIVPAAQADFARLYAGSMEVVGVSTLDEAVRVLGGPGCHPA